MSREEVHLCEELEELRSYETWWWGQGKLERVKERGTGEKRYAR